MKGIFIIGLVSAFSMYLPLGVGLVKKSYRNKDLRLFFFYIVLMSICQAIMLFFALTYRWLHISNTFVIHFGSVIEFAVLSYMMLGFERDKKAEKILYQLGVIVFAGMVYDQIIVSSLNENSISSLTAGSFYLLALSLRSFFNVLPALNVQKILIMLGLVLYTAINSAVYPSYKNFDPFVFRLILMTTTLIVNIIFGVGLFVCPKQSN